ncbi:MAG: ATP-binding cassette domain-containing protein [Clostridiales bacterium]|jgi:energy-coupling factor transport system ATP-binding protein|nr:ATP-binding cassette domain-containing protein [Clostridiales bacterium]
MESYRAEKLTFYYPERKKPALDNISLKIEQGAFVTLCGPSGCGKTTLLRQFKPSLAPHGTVTGAIYFEGTELSLLSQRDASAKIGFVMQNPENQIVTDKVWHELAFGLESLGCGTAEIRLRVAEMASFFGIQAWFYKNVTELSGGQKQLLALASVMATQPKVLILDEPTSQLDPIAASEFLMTVSKINRELGVTVILTEHRLEEIFPLSDRIIVMDSGKILAEGTSREVGLALRERGHGMFLAMPAAMRIWAGINTSRGEDCPVTVRDGSAWLYKRVSANKDIIKPDLTDNVLSRSAPPVIEFEEVWFKYGQNLPDVIKGLSYKMFPGELTAIIGGNGTGKTTALSLMARLNHPYRGKVLINGQPIEKTTNLLGGFLGALPQNPQSLFVKKNVREDLLEILSDMKLTKAEKMSRLENITALCRLNGFLDSHPYDLSGGEQQRAALAKVLLLRPRVLLLDEPTKGLDAEFKQVFAGILKKLTSAGVAVIMVSHDIEFCAEHADRCALFFDGGIVSEGTPRNFFSGNSFYTSSANRMARFLLPKAVTVADVIASLGGQTTGAADIDIHGEYSLSDGQTYAGSSEPAKNISSFRKAAAVAASSMLILTIIFAMFHFDGLKAFVSGGDIAVSAASNAADAWKYAGIIFALAGEMIALVLALTWKRAETDALSKTSPEKRNLSKRTLAAAGAILLMIPLTIYTGYYFLDDRKYYLISLLIILETMLPFALVFEARKPQARELIVIAVLCAIAVAGRTAFFMLPQFKPVIALVIIAGVAFGGEAGFLVGAMTGFVSNMFFGQGPWTPWQMFAFGMIGFLAGILFRKGLLRRHSGSLAVFGAFAAFFIYGGVMNPAMVLMYQPTPTKEMLIAAYLQGIPFDLVHATATVMFLLIISQAMLEKLDRIKVKYGLVE